MSSTHWQDFKIVKITPPAAIVDNAAYTTTEVDTLGFDACNIIVHLGATDIALAVCKVQQSDTSGSGFADITNLDTDGDTDIDGNAATLPTATDDNGFVIFDIDLRGKKRYLDLSITAGDGTAGTYATAFVLLWKAAETPTTSAQRGALNVMRA